MTRPSPKARTLGGLVALAVLLVLCVGAALVFSHLPSVVLATASRRLGRPVHVDGGLSAAPRLSGITVRFDELHVDQPAWVGGGDLVRVRRGELTLPWTALIGDGRITALTLQGFAVNLKRDASGRANWTSSAGGPARPPQIGGLTLSDGVLDLDDRQHQVSFRGAVATRGSGSKAVVTVNGAGRSQGDPWSEALVAGVGIGARPADLSLRLTLDRAGGRSVLTVSGRVAPRPWRLEGRIASEGPDLHDFSPLLQTPLFRTPAYTLRAQLAVDAKAVRLSRIEGRIGASDLDGAVVVTPQPDGRRLDIAVHVRSLRISDLFSIASGGKLTARRAPGRLLPEAPLNLAPLRPLTGRIDVVADSVQAPTVPTIRSLRLHIALDHGRAAADPMIMDLAHGRMIAHVALDGRSAPPRIAFGLDLQHADIRDFHRALGAEPPLQATFDAHLRLAGQGDSLSAALTQASGRFQLRALSGRVRRVQADILSAAFADGLLTLLTRNDPTVGLSCAAADFDIRRGQARVRTLRLSSPAGDVTGEGGLNLGAQTIDLTLHRVGGAPTAVRVSGQLTQPHAALSVENPVAAVRNAVAGLARMGTKPRAPAGCG